MFRKSVTCEETSSVRVDSSLFKSWSLRQGGGGGSQYFTSEDNEKIFKIVWKSIQPKIFFSKSLCPETWQLICKRKTYNFKNCMRSFPYNRVTFWQPSVHSPFAILITLITGFFFRKIRTESKVYANQQAYIDKKI